VEQKERFEKALKKILRNAANQAGKLDTLEKRVEQLENSNAKHSKAIVNIKFSMIRLNDKISTIRSGDIKRITAFLQLVATKKGMNNALTLLKSVDIENLKSSQLTWTKLLAGIVSVYGAMEVIKKIATGQF